MIVTLLMTLEGSRPEISRLINVEEDVRLGELAPLIDAAFGFSGTSGHLYMGTVDGEPTLISATPAAEESDESTLTVGDIGVMTYVYEPTANWNIRLEVLGVADIDTPSPMLVDAQGPDVIEACGGPEMMSSFHREARRLAAGLDPDMKISPLLLSFMPVMSPERLIQRLSSADHTSVAERIAFTAENLFFDDDDDFSEDPRTPDIAEKFDSFVESRPDLQEILSIDPNPERNPALIAAISEFFSDHVPESPEMSLYPFTRIVANIRAFLHHCALPVKLTPRGTFRAPDVRTLAEAIGVHGTETSDREEATPPVAALRTFLEFAGLLAIDGDSIIAREDAITLAQNPDSLLTVFEDEFYRFYAEREGEDAEQNLRWAFRTADMDETALRALAPNDPLFLVNLLISLGIYEPGSTPETPLLTAPGSEVLAIMLDME